MVREIPDLKLNAKLARNTKFRTNFWLIFFLSSALQINIVPLPVTMNRKIEKPLVKLNFRRSK